MYEIQQQKLELVMEVNINVQMEFEEERGFCCCDQGFSCTEYFSVAAL